MDLLICPEKVLRSLHLIFIEFLSHLRIMKTHYSKIFQASPGRPSTPGAGVGVDHMSDPFDQYPFKPKPSRTPTSGHLTGKILDFLNLS